MAAAFVPTAHAERWSVDLGIGTELTWSSNPQLGVTSGRSDAILDVRPRFAIRGDGPRLRLGGSAALNAITTANDTQPSRILPEADLNARLEAVERFLYLEAGIRALQTSVSPFGVRPEAATNLNTLTTGQLRFSPSIESAVSPNTRYRVRSDNTWSKESGSTTTVPATASAGGYFGRHAALFEHDPRPLGWRVEVERSETRYNDDARDPLILDLARLSLDYAIGSEWLLGVRAGRERTSLLPDDGQGSIYGVQARWQPSPRTTLTAFDEKRFFGSAWRLSFDHRMRQFAWNMLLSRTLDTTPQSLFELPPTDNVAGLLDAIFTSSFPEAAARADAVQDFMAGQGLPGQILRPTSLYAQRLSLVTTRSATFALIGVRNSLSISGFQSRTEDAAEGGPLVTGGALTNNTQYGAALALSHRLTPTLALNFSTDWSRIRALQSADRSIQRTARLRVTVQTAPKSNAYVGARYRALDSNVATEGREGAVFVGLDHSF